MFHHCFGNAAWADSIEIRDPVKFQYYYGLCMGRTERPAPELSQFCENLFYNLFPEAVIQIS